MRETETERVLIGRSNSGCLFVRGRGGGGGVVLLQHLAMT